MSPPSFYDGQYDSCYAGPCPPGLPLAGSPSPPLLDSPPPPNPVHYYAQPRPPMHLPPSAHNGMAQMHPQIPHHLPPSAHEMAAAQGMPALLPQQLQGASGYCGGDLCDLEDPSYYSTLLYRPDQQVVVLTSRIKDKVSAQEKTRWLDQQLSYRQCPYPIRHIEFTHSGDAVVEFVSNVAMAKSLQQSSLKWGRPASQDVATRPCTEDDIRALFWVGVAATGATSASLMELLPQVRQALQQYGEVRGEYAPHPSSSDANTPSHLRVAPPSMLKLYFAPSGRRRLPPSIPVSRPDRPKGFPPMVARVFTPHGHGPLAVKCADFGPFHSEAKAAAAAERQQQQQQQQAGRRLTAARDGERGISKVALQ
ncbi:unnamed protein product [Closterium sp. NIES-53]